MSKEIREQIDKVKNWKPILKESMVSYQKTQGKLKEFAEGLKSHLEKNGYTVMDNPSSEVDETLILDKRNIIFSFNPYDGADGEVLYVYYDKNNEEAISSIVNYLDYLNKNEFDLESKASKYTTAMQDGYLFWYLNVKKNERVVVGYRINFIQKENYLKYVINNKI
jgi:hypothetical protein